MKILLTGLFNSKKNDAVKIHFLEIAKALSEIENDVTILIPKGDIEKKFSDRINIIYLPVNYSDNLIGILISSLIQLFYYTIIIDNSYEAVYNRWRLFPSLFFKIINFMKRIKVKFVSEHNGWAELECKIENSSKIKQKIALYTQLIDAKFSDKVVVVTPGIKRKLRLSGISNRKIYTIGNGTDINHFFIRKNRSQEKEKEFGHDKIVLGFIGNVAKWQGIDELINLFVNIKDEIPNLILLIIGSGNMKELYENKIIENNSNRIFIKENIQYEKMNYWLNVIDIAFAPKSKLYDEIGYSPLKIRDYASCGKTIISTNVSGIKEMAIHDWLYVYDPFFENDFEEVLRKVLQVDFEENSLKARKFAEENFQWKIVAKKIYQTIKE